jgi:hypothetical protein
LYFDGNISFKKDKCKITGKRFNPFPYEKGRAEEFKFQEEEQDGWFKLDSSKKTVEISPDRISEGGWSIFGTYRFFSFNNKSGVSNYIRLLPNNIPYFLLTKGDRYIILIHDKIPLAHQDL